MLDAKKTTIRALSGGVYVLLIILACCMQSLGVALLALLFGILGISEFRKMRFGSEGVSMAMNLYNMVGGACLIFAPVPTMPLPYAFALLWVLWLIGRMILTIYSGHQHPEKVFAVDMAAQIYIALPMALMTYAGLHLSAMGSSCLPLLAMFIIIWVNDTGAFIVGSIFGRHRLLERVSPKKSWEGFWGGAIFAIVVAAAMGAFWPALAIGSICNHTLFWAIGGLIVALASTFGDLFESVIKRNLNLKDSGNLIPGHGGILDRIDSLLMVIPAMTVYYIIYSSFFSNQII